MKRVKILKLGIILSVFEQDEKFDSVECFIMGFRSISVTLGFHCGSTLS